MSEKVKSAFEDIIKTCIPSKAQLEAQYEKNLRDKQEMMDKLKKQAQIDLQERQQNERKLYNDNLDNLISEFTHKVQTHTDWTRPIVISYRNPRPSLSKPIDDFCKMLSLHGFKTHISTTDEEKGWETHVSDIYIETTMHIEIQLVMAKL